MRVLDKQDVEDLLVGAKILGAGGGGEVEWAKPMIEEVYAKSKRFRIIDLKEISDDEIVVIVGRVGGGVSKRIKRRLAGLPRIEEKPELVARRVLAEYLGKEPYAYLASEIGAGNTVVPMYVAAMTDSLCVDADCCGRAKPEISISTTNVKGLPVTPLSIVSPFGDAMILKKAVDDARSENICRQMAVASGGICGVARCPIKGKNIKEAVVPGSISRAMTIGRRIREAGERGKNPVEALIRASNGFRLFHGKVKSFEMKEQGAFIWGTIKVTGTGDYARHELKIWYKNEFLISWKDEKPFVTCPDTICVVDAGSAGGLSCWGGDFKKDKEVVVIGRKAHSLWRTERGLELFSPKHFGLNIKYIPIEQIVEGLR